MYCHALNVLMYRKEVVKISSKSRVKWPTILMIVLIVVFSFISLLVGAVGVTLDDFLSGDSLAMLLLFETRAPRVLAIIATGAGMSVAGLLMQNLTANKFVSPDTGATISSAQLGILLSFAFFPGATLIEKTLMSFTFALLGTWIFVLFIQKVKFKDVVMVPLVGIMLGMVISAITNYFALQLELTQAIQTALVGNFSMIVKGDYEIVFLVAPLMLIAWIFANHFNIVGLGEDLSNNLGVKYNTVMFAGLTIAAMLTASIVVTVGAIAYLGLIVPNIVAMFRGDKIRGSMLDVALFGIIFVLVCDIVCRLVIAPYELPVNLATGIIGSVIFLVMLYKRLNSGKKARKKLIDERNARNSANAENAEKAGA